MSAVAVPCKFAAAGALLAVLLAGCAPKVPAPSTQTFLVPTNFQKGVVVAIRPIDIPAEAGSRTGLEAVLATLRQTAPAGEVAAQEIVIRRDDDSVVSVVDRNGASGFVTGNAIAIAEGASTTLIHRN